LILQSFTLLTCGFTLWAISYLTITIGRLDMSTQESIDALVVVLARAKEEIVSELATVQAQLSAANVPAEVVNLDALNAAAQALDDIVPDAPPVS